MRSIFKYTLKVKKKSFVKNDFKTSYRTSYFPAFCLYFSVSLLLTLLKLAALSVICVVCSSNSDTRSSLSLNALWRALKLLDWLDSTSFLSKFSVVEAEDKAVEETASSLPLSEFDDKNLPLKLSLCERLLREDFLLLFLVLPEGELKELWEWYFLTFAASFLSFSSASWRRIHTLLVPEPFKFISRSFSTKLYSPNSRSLFCLYSWYNLNLILDSFSSPIVKQCKFSLQNLTESRTFSFKLYFLLWPLVSDGAILVLNCNVTWSCSVGEPPSWVGPSSSLSADFDTPYAPTANSFVKKKLFTLH